MEFRLLGPLVLETDSGPVRLRGPRQRALLAVLLLHAGEVLSTEALIEEIWGLDAPATAETALHVHISKLRKAFRDAGEPDVLVTRVPGYLLEIDASQVDVRAFEQLVRTGRKALAARDPISASESLKEALSLWRGPALADFRDAPFAQPHIARLEELRLQALEEQIEAALALGRQRELVGELEGLVVEHPGRERFWAQLMLALYRAGRQADALAAYRQARRVLLDELGIEPSRSLRELERAVLMQDATLDGVCTPDPTDAPSALPPAARRKTVTVVAARMAPVGAACDPEAVSKLSASWEREAARAILRHGGQVHRLTGDSILGLFGALDSNEDDALRAARSANDLRVGLSRTNDDLELRLGVRIESAIGLSTGELLVGPETDAYAGQPLRAAAALADSTSPGEIHVDETTKTLLGVAAAVEADTNRDGTTLWRLLAVSNPGQRGPLRLDSPMVGRALELARLHAALETVGRGRCARLVVVTGPAGIGKSRLAAEFRDEVASQATILAGRCLPYGDGITFWPLAEVVRQAAGDTSADTLARILRGEPDAAVIAAQIAGAIGTGRPAAGGEETFWAARRLFERLARDRPLVLIIEDLHWAEQTLLDLIEHVVDWVADAPVLVLGLARPELHTVRPSLLTKANADEITVSALDDGDARTLVRHLVGKRMGALDRDRIIEAGGGNPLFIEELTLTLQNRRADDAAIPPTVHALIAARLDQLGDPERALLEIAAVIGKQFPTDALAALAPGGIDVRLDEHLETLTAGEFIRADGGTFEFRHLLVRDVAYAAMSKTHRADIHQRYAEWLAAEVGLRLPEYEEVIGYHLEEAVGHRRAIGVLGSRDRGVADRAAMHLAEAARRAYARDDRPAEVRLLSRASALLDGEDGRVAELSPGLAEALRETGDFAGASRLADKLAGEGDPAAAARGRLVQLRLALQTQTAFHLDEVEREAAQAIEALAAAGDERWLARAGELLAWVPYLRCRAADAEGPLDEALGHARAAKDGRQEARLLSLLFSVLIYGPLPVGEAVKRCEPLLEDGAIGRIRASALRVLATLRGMEGDFTEGRRLFRQDRRLLRELGLPLVAARASVAYGQLELLAGDPERAERELRRGLARLKRFGERGALSNVAAVLAQALCEQDRYEEALELTGLAKETAAEEDISAQVYWRMPRGLALLQLDEAEDGEALLRSAVDLASKTDFLNTHAEALAYLGAAVKDERLLEQAAELYERKGNVAASSRLRSGAPVY